MGVDTYRSVLEKLPDGFARYQAIDGDYIYLAMNPAYEEMTGLARERVIGRKVSELADVIDHSGFDWTAILEQATLAENGAFFGQYCEHVDRYCEITAYSDEPGFVNVLIRTKNTYASLFETAPYIILLLNSDACIQDINQAGLEFLRTSKEKVLGQTCGQLFSCVHAETGLGCGKTSFCPRCPIRSSITQTVQTGQSVRNKEGSLTFRISGTCHSRYLLISTALEQVRGEELVFLTLVDITDRKHAERKLQESEARYRSIVEHTNDALYIHDFQGKILDVNDNACEVSGYARHELLAMNLSGLNSAAEQQDMPERMHTLITRGSVRFEGEFLRKDGSMIRGDVSVRVVSHEGNGIVQSFVRDLTERRKDEESLQRFRIALDSSPDCVFIINRETMQFVDSNSTACRELGYDLSELLSMGPHDIKPDYTRDQLVALFDSVLEEPVNCGRIETIHRRKNGSTFPVEIFLQGFRSNEGPMLIASARDISKRKQADEKLLEYTKELELRNRAIDVLYQTLNAEMEGARKAHRRLLQENLPVVEGMELAVHNAPATFIGGDFSQVVRKGDTLIVYLSDVTGHGLAGTIFSLFVKNTIESYVELMPESALQPDRILTYLERQVRKGGYPSEYAVAIFLMRVDLGTERATFSAAGFQNPPVLVKEDGSVELLISQGLPISPDIPSELMVFTNHTLSLPKNAYLFMATDGLYEQSAGTGIYERRLLSLLQQHSCFPADTVLDLVLSDFHEFLGDKGQSDDVTAIVLSTGDQAEYNLPSTAALLHRVNELVLTYFIDNKDVEIIAMAVHELVSNALEHGNRFDANKSVRVCLAPQAVIVEDEGKGFNWRATRCATLDLDGDSDRGRGLPMIRELVGELVYNQKGNRVSLLL